MKIYRKMYNNEVKDCEIHILFSDREYNQIKDKGFIQEEHICMTSIPEMFGADIHCGIVKFGIKDSKHEFLEFEYNYVQWNSENHTLEHNIIICEGEKFTYGDIPLETVMKRFIWDLIINDILKVK